MDLENQLIRLKEELSEHVNKKGQWAMLKNNNLMYEHGDKPSTFFLSLEKSKAKNKYISKLVNDQGHTITDQTEILNEQCQFYKTLYTSSLS